MTQLSDFQIARMVARGELRLCPIVDISGGDVTVEISGKKSMHGFEQTFRFPAKFAAKNVSPGDLIAITVSGTNAFCILQACFVQHPSGEKVFL